MSDRSRSEVSRLARLIIHENPHVGAVWVAFINEHASIDGSIEVDGGAECGNARTESGAMLIVEICKRMSLAFSQILSDVALEYGQRLIDREDLAIETPGERPKA